MKTDDKNMKPAKPKKKLSTLELAQKYLKGRFGNLHLLLEPHEIPLHNSK